VTCVIRLVEFADGSFTFPPSSFVEDFDFEAEDGKGSAKITRLWWCAKQFPDPGAALDFWKTQSKTHPLRPDGEPNRPLTCTTVEVVELKP
jgi:hypothetical protein